MLDRNLGRKTTTLIQGTGLYHRSEAKWVGQNFGEFEESEDFTSVTAVTEVKNNGGTQMRKLQDYAITLDMAKQLCKKICKKC